MPHAEVTLPGSTSSVPTARRFVDSILSAWGQPELAWTATLLVSELAANSALHARTPFTVHVDVRADVVRLAVRDGSLRAPQQRLFGLESTTGRGLRMVAELASEWGVDRHADGKTVWTVLQRPPGTDPGALPDGEAEVDVDALLEAFGDDGGSVPPRADEQPVGRVAAPQRAVA